MLPFLKRLCLLSEAGREPSYMISLCISID
jgi:hypothetical protein